MQGLLAAAQDGGVARLEAQGGSVGGDVGAGLVDDADDAQRHAHLADGDAGRTALEISHLADRVGQRGDLLEADGHRLDALGGQREAVDHRRLEAVGAGLGEVAGVGVQELRGAGTDLGGHREEGLVFCVGRGGGHAARGAAGLAADGLHVGLDVHRLSSRGGAASAPCGGRAAGDAQAQLEEFVPHVAAGQALDHPVNPGCVQDGGAQGA